MIDCTTHVIIILICLFPFPLLKCKQCSCRNITIKNTFHKATQYEYWMFSLTSSVKVLFRQHIIRTAISHGDLSCVTPYPPNQQNITCTASVQSGDIGLVHRAVSLYYGLIWSGSHISQQGKKHSWRCRGSNPGLFACKANTLPLSYTPSAGSASLRTCVA